MDERRRDPGGARASDGMTHGAAVGIVEGHVWWARAPTDSEPPGARGPVPREACAATTPAGPFAGACRAPAPGAHSQ